MNELNFSYKIAMIIVRLGRNFFMKKRTKILIGSCGLLLTILGYSYTSQYGAAFRLPFFHEKKVKEVPFKDKKDPNILRISQQLNNEKITEKKSMFASGIQFFQHKPNNKNDFYTGYIDVPISIQAKFVSVIFYDDTLKHIYEIPAKRLADKTFVIQTKFFQQVKKALHWQQMVVVMTEDGNYQYKPLHGILDLPVIKKAQINAALPRPKIENKPANLFLSRRLKSIIQSVQHKKWYDYSQQEQIGFEKNDVIEAATFDYSLIDDGKFSCRIQLVNSADKYQNYHLAIWQQKKGILDLQQYPFKQISPRDFVVHFSNQTHDNYAEGNYIGYLLSNRSTNSLINATLLNHSLFIPKYILKIINYQLIPKNPELGEYQIQLTLNKNERIRAVNFDVWTKRKGKDDLVRYNTDQLSDEKFWQQTIDIRKVHFDDNHIVIKVSVDLDITGETEMGVLQMAINKNTSPIYVNHRGRQQFAPENSIPAFKQANYEAIETDIHLTADKQWVVIHDDSLNRTTNGSGEISNLLSQQLLNYHLIGIGAQQYALNELRIPTVEDYLAICKSKNKIPVIEIKTSEFDAPAYQKLIDLIRNYQLAHVVRFISFHYQPLRELKKMMPESSTMYLSKALTQHVIDQAKKLGSRSGVNIKWQSLNAQNVQQAHQAGLQVGAWTVPYDQFNKMKELGVDYITTNDD